MSKYKILMVEDDAIESMDIRRRLESFGYEVPYIASRGDEAIEKAEKMLPDLILMDISLKGNMDGIEVAEHLVHLDIPIIYLTAHSDEPTVQKAKHTQPYGYLLKPYEPNELKYAVELAIYKSKNDKKLKGSEAISRALLNASNDSVFLVDNQRVILAANEATCQRLGVSEKEIIGSSFNKFINPELAEARWKHFKTALKTKKSVEFEDTRDGIMFQHRVTPIQEDGTIQKLAVFSRDITDKKIAEQKIIESEKKYRTIFDHAGSATLLFDDTGLIHMVNSEWKKVSGYSLEEVEGKMKWMDFVHPDYLDLMIEYHQKRESGDPSVPSRYEACFIKKNGDLLSMYVSVTAMPEKGRWLASAIDINDLKKAQKDLSISEERLKMAMRSANAVLFDWNVVTGEVYFSPEFCELFGYNANEIPTTYADWVKLIHPDDREKTISNLNKQLKEKLNHFEIEYRVICKEGSIKWISSVAKGVKFDEKGIATRFIGMNQDISTRKKLEEKLKLTQFSVDRGPESIIWVTSDARIHFVNEATCKSLGYSKEELTTMTVFDIDPHFVPEKWKSHWEDIKSGKIKTLETQHRRKNGEKFDVSVAINYLQYEGVGYNCAFVRDITKEKKIEADLIESKNYLNSIINTIADPVFVKNRAHNWILLNDSFCEFIGKSRDELIGKSDYEFFPSHEADVFWEKDEEVFKTGQENVNEEEITTSKGKTRTIITKKTVYHDKSGEPYLVGVIRDITDLKDTEKSLEEQYNFLQYLLDSIPSPIFYKDSDFKYQGCNKSFEEFLGISKKSIIGKTVYDLNPPELADKFHAKDVELLNNPETQEYEAPVKYADGSLHEILFSKTTFNDSEGNVAGMIGVMSDITEIRNAEKALQISERKYKEIFENINTAVAVYEVEDDGETFKFKDLNRAGAKIEKISRKEVIGKKVAEIFPSVEEFGILNAFKRVWETGQPERFPLAFYQDERISGWRDNYIYKLPSGEIVAVYDDLTPQKQAEEEIELNIKRLKVLVKILQYDPQSVQDLLDYSLEEAIKLTESKIGYIYHYYPDKKQFVLNTWSKDVMKECSIREPSNIYELEKTGIWGEAVRQRKSFIINDFQAPHPLKKGYPQGHAPLYRYMTLPVFSQGEIVAVVGVANKERDYTETDLLQLELLMDAVWKVMDRQKAEEALKISETEYKAIFENTGTAISISEDNMVLSLVNQEFADLVGYSKEEIENKMSWTEFFVEDQLERMMNYHRLRRVDPNKAPKNYESQVKTKKREILDVYMSVAMVPGTKKSLISVLDITEKKQSRKKLRRELNINKALARIYAPLISPDSHIEDISVAILKEAQNLTDSEHGYVSAINPLTGDNVAHSLTQMMPDCGVVDATQRVITLPINPDGTYNGLWGHSLNTGKSFFTNSPKDHPSAQGIPEGHIELEKFLSIPVFLGNKLIGQIAVANASRDYAQKDVDALKRIAEFYALAIRSKEAEKELKESLEEKKTLLREIHHRVKNNMQIVSSLLNLEKHWDSERDPLEILTDSQNRIKFMSIVHELLYQSDNLSKVDFKRYIERITHYLFIYYSIIKIKLNLDLEETYLNIETAVPCGLIINELVSNSLKHAFPSEEGEIRVSFHKIGEYYQLTVKDNGIGLPKDLDLEKSNTLGLYLVNSLVKQIDGSLEVNGEEGAEFKIIFKELKYKKRV